MAESNSAAHCVLQHYPLAGLATFVSLGNRGGFSGARLWRAESLAGPICLRAWPEGTTPARLTAIHQFMDQARQAGLAFVPTVQRTKGGQTHVYHEGRCWDVTAWMPGTADFHARPSPERLANACTALAELHRAWAGPPRAGPCPAVLRRLERIAEWQALLSSGWRPDFESYAAAPWHRWTQRAWQVLQARIPELPAKLAAWRDVSLPLQPCLCDIWHDHVLYRGDEVTGLIDYGSVKTDHVAVDLARLLGSLVGDDESMRVVGLEAYGGVVRLAPFVPQLVGVLDETGTVLGVANWLVWLYHDDRTFSDAEAVSERLATLVERIE
jgi:Ser/Thr protein kinase RdoA (MazF antagonist)